MMNRSLLPTLLLLLLIFSASDELMGRTAEARVCKSQSHHFHGTCLSNHNCAVVCRTEGFSGGDCVGFRRRCFCTRHC
ncbi:defensin-like protein 1 [Cucurbita pepo subsp. pepo]|uniref:Defensin-like protein 1 n=1 Tax=Cucurbita maxima TaxID=3661 RepID=A0A6J1I9R5_CUCMA|nr:defensin-like protein 1 [Cucurbita maxima]XP_023512106.1 defensin-like protein 1 [Cucurbita pepo subsp. pepo]